MPKLTYPGSVKDGQIKLPKRMRTEMIQTFEGKAITVTVERKRKSRSLAQNAYYWSTVLPIITQVLYDFAPENGLDPEHTHQMFKEWFLPKVVEPPKINLPNGEIRKGVYSTTKLTTSEFMDYLSLIDAWCQDFGIVVPEPNPNWNLEEGMIDIDKQ